MIEYLSNTDDEFITPTGVTYNFSRMFPTAMSASIARIQLEELCEEAVNRLPFNRLNYDIVLALDAQFQEYLRSLPVFFQLDAASIRQSQAICEKDCILHGNVLSSTSVPTRDCAGYTAAFTRKAPCKVVTLICARLVYTQRGWC